MLLTGVMTRAWGRGEEGRVGVGDHREGDGPVPGGVHADLVVVEADLVLGRLEPPQRSISIPRRGPVRAGRPGGWRSSGRKPGQQGSLMNRRASIHSPSPR